MKNRPVKWLATAIGAALLAGCISHEETVYRDVDRVKVEFENDKAARIFYEAVSAQHPSHGSVDSTTEVELPVIFKHKSRVVSGPNAAFNEAVSRCDTNKDGRITETEARIFSEQKGKL
jgi:hypothetical protein